jgi:Tfp pilus assembly protein PilO
MVRYILPIILIGVAIVGFLGFTSPFYQTVVAQREQIASYNDALNNAQALEAARDELTQKYNSFDLNNLARLQKLLPDNVDNIRLILEIGKIAAPYGMVLKNVQYDSLNNTTTASTAPVTTDLSNKSYGVWNLSFSTQGSYSNFINFIKDLENNLRIVDISSIAFSSNSNSGTVSGVSSDSYKYDFKIKTYWLKN